MTGIKMKTGGEPGKPIAVFNTTHPWLRSVVERVAPPDFALRFVDLSNPDVAEAALPDADFLVTVVLDRTQIALLRRCKLVQLQGVGYDGVDVAALRAKGIPLAATSAGTIVGVAEHTLLLILALYKQLLPVHQQTAAGVFDSLGWRAGSHFLCEKTVGIVGLGRIGQRVARLLRAFDAQTIYTDVMRLAPEQEKTHGLTYAPFEELLAAADVVTVHTPLTSATANLFNATTFAQMKPGALFINTSRGGTYDMDALAASLCAGHLAGAGLDVFNPEPPPPDHPLLRRPDVICTPHMATGTVEAHEQKTAAQFANFARVLRGEAPHELITT